MGTKADLRLCQPIGFHHPMHFDDKQHHVHWLDLVISNEELDLLCLIGQHRQDGSLRCDNFLARILVG